MSDRCPACGCIGRAWSRLHAPHCEGAVIDGLRRIEDALDPARLHSPHDLDAETSDA